MTCWLTYHPPQIFSWTTYAGCSPISVSNSWVSNGATFSFLVKFLLLWGLPFVNAVAYLLTGEHGSQHATPLFKHLHWLPIYYRAGLKVCELIYEVLNNLGSVYPHILIFEVKHWEHLQGCHWSSLKLRRFIGLQHKTESIFPVLWSGTFCFTLLEKVTENFSMPPGLCRWVWKHLW